MAKTPVTIKQALRQCARIERTIMVHAILQDGLRILLEPECYVEELYNWRKKRAKNGNR